MPALLSPIIPMPAGTILDIHDVTKTYGRYEALKGVSLSVDKRRVHRAGRAFGLRQDHAL